MFYGVFYTSRTRPDFDSEMAMDICHKANKKNQEQGITGFLSYDKSTFFQFIEGEEAAVRQLMGKIIQDDRHSPFRIIHEDQYAKRLLPNWHMHFVNLEVTQPFVLKTIQSQLAKSKSIDRSDLIKLVHSLKFQKNKTA